MAGRPQPRSDRESSGNNEKGRANENVGTSKRPAARRMTDRILLVPTLEDGLCPSRPPSTKRSRPAFLPPRRRSAGRTCRGASKSDVLHTEAPPAWLRPVLAWAEPSG